MGGKRKLREEDEGRIMKKIRKLEKELKRRRRIISSDESESDIEGQVLPEQSPPAATPPASPAASPRASTMNVAGITLDMPRLISPMVYSSEFAPAAQTSAVPVSVDYTIPKPGPSAAPDIEMAHDTFNEREEYELEEAILDILGEAPQPDLALGKNIHKDIASRWQNILSKGLTKETKELINKKYAIPANCNFLVAPLLNPEAKAAMPDILVKRDASLSQKQNQIGIALAALSQVTELILKNESSKQALLQPLSDACRLLCDSHNIETKTLRSIIMSSINTSLREAITDTDRDTYLFGEGLAEKLKIAKSVQKTGESLLKSVPVSSSNKGQNTRIFPRNRALNYRGPVQRKPPNRPSQSTRGRPTARQSRSTAQPRPPPAPRPLSPLRRSYRR